MSAIHRFSVADAIAVTGLRAADLDSWLALARLGIKETAGSRTFRRLSGDDLIALKLVASLTGSVMPGCRRRTFITPAQAFAAVEACMPALRESGQDRLLLCWEAAGQQLVAAMLKAKELPKRLSAVSQALVVPADRLSAAVRKACAEIMEAKGIGVGKPPQVTADVGESVTPESFAADLRRVFATALEGAR